MPDPQPATVPNELRDYLSPEALSPDSMRSTKEQRVMGDQQIGMMPDCILYHFICRVYSTIDSADRPVQAADDKPRFIPVFRIPQRIQVFQNRNCVLKGQHCAA